MNLFSGNPAAIIGLTSTLITSLIALAGIYWKSSHDESLSREEQFVDSLWKSLTMLNEKVDNLEKQHDIDRNQVDVLRSEVWETRQKLFISQNESAKLTADLSHKEDELARSKEALAKTDAELEKTRNELQAMQKKLQEIEQNNQQNKDTGVIVSDIV